MHSHTLHSFTSTQSHNHKIAQLCRSTLCSCTAAPLHISSLSWYGYRISYRTWQKEEATRIEIPPRDTKMSVTCFLTITRLRRNYREQPLTATIGNTNIPLILRKTVRTALLSETHTLGSYASEFTRSAEWEGDSLKVVTSFHTSEVQTLAVLGSSSSSRTPCNTTLSAI